MLQLDHDVEGFAGITDELARKLTDAFELATMLETQARNATQLREGAHRIAIDAHHLRTRVERLQGDLASHKAESRADP